MVLLLEKLGIQVEAHHHEVATGGQGEIDMRFTTLTRMADNVMIYKYVVKGVARKRGMTATFMPKPLFGDNGSGHARPPEHLESQEADFRGRRVCRVKRNDALLHWRASQARASALRNLRADGELLPPVGARRPAMTNDAVLG